PAGRRLPAARGGRSAGRNGDRARTNHGVGVPYRYVLVQGGGEPLWGREEGCGQPHFVNGSHYGGGRRLALSLRAAQACVENRHKRWCGGWSGRRQGAVRELA